VPALDRARLARLAVTDAQTLAFNHRVLLPRLTEEMERAQRYVIPLSYLLMDLDHFKQVNDTHGHAAGDRVLREFADRVRALVRRPDVLVRRGGEEFVLIMPHTTEPQARIVAERIRQHLESRPLHGADDLEIPQTVSIGVATWNGRDSAQELDQRADAAMYEAKRAGRNRVMVAIQGEEEPIGGAGA
jgi:diguanylate cyclase (GGDEF)-like protein